jgi:selenocysteine lyase/cysteine desulfurase
MSNAAVDERRRALRNQFLLRPDVIFLNHGSFGACPRPVFEAYQNWQRELESQPVEFLGRRFDDLIRAAREALGAYVGADADDLRASGQSSTAPTRRARCHST